MTGFAPNLSNANILGKRTILNWEMDFNIYAVGSVRESQSIEKVSDMAIELAAWIANKDALGEYPLGATGMIKKRKNLRRLGV